MILLIFLTAIGCVNPKKVQTQQTLASTQVATRAEINSDNE